MICDDREQSGFQFIQFLSAKLQVPAFPEYDPGAIHAGTIRNFVLGNTGRRSKLPKFRICHSPPPEPHLAQSSIAARLSGEAVRAASGLNREEKSRSSNVLNRRMARQCRLHCARPYSTNSRASLRETRKLELVELGKKTGISFELSISVGR